MSYEVQDFWFFDGESGCEMCQSYTGGYHAMPSRPHAHCDCPIEHAEVKAELISSTVEVVDRYESIQEIDWIPKGGKYQKSVTWSTSHTTTRKAGGSISEGGFNVNIGMDEADSVTTADSATTTFEYDDEEGGDSQLIVAAYNVTVYQEVKVWRASWQGNFEEFETVDVWEETDFAGYDQIGF